MVRESTTFVRRFLPYYADCINFVNADLDCRRPFSISTGHSRHQSGEDHAGSDRRAHQSGHDFAIETTLAGRSYAGLLKNLKKESYKIHLFYLRLHKLDLALKRIAERVRAHDVPSGGCKTQVCSGRVQFHLYRPLLDSWMLFDNSADLPRLIADEESGNF